MGGNPKITRSSLRLQLKAVECLSKEKDRSIATPAAVHPRKNPIAIEGATAGEFLKTSLPKNRQIPFLGGPLFQTVPAIPCSKSLPNTSSGDTLTISHNNNIAVSPKGWSATPAAGHTQTHRAPDDAPFAVERVTDFARNITAGFTTESNTSSMINDARPMLMPRSGRVAPRGGSANPEENRPQASRAPQPQIYAQRKLPAPNMTSSGPVSSVHSYNQPQAYAPRELPALNSM